MAYWWCVAIELTVRPFLLHDAPSRWMSQTCPSPWGRKSWAPLNSAEQKANSRHCVYRWRCLHGENRWILTSGFRGAWGCIRFIHNEMVFTCFLTEVLKCKSSNANTSEIQFPWLEWCCENICAYIYMNRHIFIKVYTRIRVCLEWGLFIRQKARKSVPPCVHIHMPAQTCLSV